MSDKNKAISYEIGRMVWICYEHSVHAEMHDSTLNLIELLKDSLDIEVVIEGMYQVNSEFSNYELENEDIILMLEVFGLN